MLISDGKQLRSLKSPAGSMEYGESLFVVLLLACYITRAFLLSYLVHG
jgi:hypothetical protein